MQAAADDDDDVVVREVDVYWCGGTLDHTELLLLQSPLRPPWRQYDVEGFTAVRWKPKAKKLELEAPLDNTHPTYDEDSGPGRHMDKVVLTSSKIDLCTNFACGSIRNNKLLLTPLHGALQLRQSLAHCNLDAQKPAREASKKQDAGLVQMQVQVQKRENERQIAARKSSYAYLAAQEADEPWKELKYEDENSDDATLVWELMMAVREGMNREIQMETSRKEFLEAIVPGPSGRALAEQEAHRAQLESLEHGGQGQGGAAHLRQSNAVELSDAVRKDLAVQLATLFHHQQLVNLADIRVFLSRLSGARCKDVLEAPDTQLHSEIMAAGEYMFIKKVYLRKTLGNSVLDPVRSMILELFKTKDALRKGDVSGAAKAQGVELTDMHYIKIMKALCESKGGQWTLRSGAQGLS